MHSKRADHVILAVHITDRITQASRVQTILTDYGRNIKTRIGLHEASGETAAPNGMIILEMVGDRDHSLTIIEKLNALEGVEAKSITFTH